MDELKRLEADLEGEKNQIRDDKIELEILKNELKTIRKYRKLKKLFFLKYDLYEYVSEIA